VSLAKQFARDFTAADASRGIHIIILVSNLLSENPFRGEEESRLIPVPLLNTRPFGSATMGSSGDQRCDREKFKYRRREDALSDLPSDRCSTFVAIFVDARIRETDAG